MIYNKVETFLTEKSQEALKRAAKNSRPLTQHDVINRAIQLYDFVVAELGDDPGHNLLLDKYGKQFRVSFRDDL